MHEVNVEAWIAAVDGYRLSCVVWSSLSRLEY